MPNVVKLILQTIDMMTAVVRPFVFSARACAITSNNFSSSELNREPTTTIFNRINDTSNNPSQLNTATPNGNNLPASSTTDCNTSDIKVSNPNPPNTKAAESDRFSPAEIFSLGADDYLWAYAQAGRYNSSYTDAYTRELPPRY